MVRKEHSTVMISAKGLLHAVALFSAVDVVMSTRGVLGVKSGWRLKEVNGGSALRENLQNIELNEVLLGAATVGNATSVQQLLDAGANPNALHENGMDTPLINASLHGFINVVCILLNAGADVNLADRQGNTALHFAAWNGYTEVVRILLENGADHSSQNFQGWTPLHFASRHGHPEVLDTLIYAGGDVSSQNQDGSTPLHYAARYGYFAAVKSLLQRGANTEVETFVDRLTPMNLAAIVGSGITIRTLIEAGADKDHKTAASDTPLIHAAYWGHQEAIGVLIENGADKSVYGGNGLTAEECLCHCTIASEIDPKCEVEACINDGIMKKLLRSRTYSKHYVLLACLLLLSAIALEVLLILYETCCLKEAT